MIAADLGAAYTLSGRVDAAVRLLTRVIESQSTAMEGPLYDALSACPGGGADADGSPEKAHALAERALALAQARQQRDLKRMPCASSATSQRDASLQSAIGEEYYRQALALAEELGTRPLVAHCHLGLGTLYAKSGLRAEARAPCPPPSKSIGPWR